MSSIKQPIIFDGNEKAALIEKTVTSRVKALADQGKQLKLAAIVYAEDSGSILYTRLKKEAAERAGIGYEPHTFSMTEATEKVAEIIRKLNQDPTITGIIIQKPARKTWQAASMVDGEPKAIKQAFNSWWLYQTSQLNLAKDVDGLHPETLLSFEQDTWLEKGSVLPATAKAVLKIIAQSQGLGSEVQTLGQQEFIEKLAISLADKKIIILGQSDILGKPLFSLMKNHQLDVEMIGSRELNQRQEQGRGLKDAQVIVSATGHKHLITADMVEDGVVVIDVGEPQPDVEWESVSKKASFITPVPGGVGPMTVACLLENAVELVEG